MWKNNNTRMHGLSDIGPNVPAFLIKLWKLVNDPETDELICWSEIGMSFIINKPAQFAKELLSLYYKHNNMASFIRQLNMYGFHKIVSEVGGTKNDKDYMEFAHQCFLKDHPYLLENIKRKLPNPKSGVVPNNELLNNVNVKNGTQSEILAKLLSDVNNLKGKQESWDARLASMKRENEALWRELAIFRQKHLKQEQIINRLIHFIVTIVQPSRNAPLRRRYPLMLNDIQPVKKISKLSTPDASSVSEGSPTGPTIHEIDTTDVIFGSPGQSETHDQEIEFISMDLPEASPKFTENKKTDKPEKSKKRKLSIKDADTIPEDWLEIKMMEGDLIDPLTPVDPAKINPAVAAATLKHLEGTNKKTSPIAITIPSITTSTESGKKNVTEKKVIYLTDINSGGKGLKKNSKKPIVLKIDASNSKSSKNDNEDLNSSSADLLFNLMSKSGETSGKPTRQATSTAKRKISSLVTSPSVTQILNKKPKKADSNNYVPELELDDLEFLLAAKQPDDGVAESRESEKFSETVTTESANPFLKLQSLYDGTISEDQLTSPKNTSDVDLAQEENLDDADDTEKLSTADLIDATNFNCKDKESTNNDVLNFDPDAMAVVCQPSGGTDNLARELTSHVDSVQGEIDYLKEMLKGEGYNFDPNSLPWLFNEDPLSYGVLPPMDEENQKKNEEAGVSGNELMTYGAPNLMDLVDMIGSTPSNQDWTNVLSPSSPLVSDLATPAPSPSTFNFPTPSKLRKK